MRCPACGGRVLLPVTPGTALERGRVAAELAGWPASLESVAWSLVRPATTVTTDARVSAPQHHDKGVNTYPARWSAEIREALR